MVIDLISSSTILISSLRRYLPPAEAAIAVANDVNFCGRWMRVLRIEHEGVKAMTAHPDGLPASRRLLISISVPLISNDVVVLSFIVLVWLVVGLIGLLVVLSQVGVAHRIADLLGVFGDPCWFLSGGYLNTLTELVDFWIATIVKPEDRIRRLLQFAPVVRFTIGEVH
jgi:hypothetical protein